MIDFVATIWAWSEGHRWAVWTLAALSFGSLVVSGVLVSAVLLRLPPDHYSRSAPPPRAPGAGIVSVFTGGLWLVVRNVLGWMFVAAGVAMLVLPGQGLLSILAGLVLVDFPGKQRFERRLLASPVVRQGMNWLRRRAGRPPLDFT